MNENKRLTAFSNLIKAKLLKYELLMIVLVVLVIMLRYKHIPFSGILAVVTLTALSVIYYLFAFSTTDEPNLTKYDRFIYMISSFGSSLSLIGILFTLQRWPGEKNMLLAGLLLLLIALIYIIIQNSKGTRPILFNTPFIVRILVMLVASGFMLGGIL